ncbi:MAG: acyltransferase, partial [Vicinamibacteria bacterium]
MQRSVVSGAQAAPTREPAPPPNVRRAPAPLRGGPPALWRFMRAHHMLNRRYARLIARWLWLKLRWRGRLRTDGLCFVCPGVKIEIGRGARLHLGRWSWIGHGCKIRVHEGEARIGAKTVLGQECTISAFQHVSIGRECIVADRVMLIDFDHGVVETEVGDVERDVDGIRGRRLGLRQAGTPAAEIERFSQTALMEPDARRFEEICAEWVRLEGMEGS